VTLAQFKAKVKSSLDARASIKDLETQLEAARIDRDNADAVSTEAALCGGVFSARRSEPRRERRALRRHGLRAQS
jgi:hypothetical protein